MAALAASVYSVPSRHIPRREERPLYTPLTDVDAAQLDAHRQTVQKLIDENGGGALDRTVENDLLLLDRLIGDRVLTEADIPDLTAMSIAFGDVLTTEFGLEWASTDHGGGPGLVEPGTQRGIEPTDLVLGRYARRQPVDFEALLMSVEEMRG